MKLAFFCIISGIHFSLYMVNSSLNIRERRDFEHLGVHPQAFLECCTVNYRSGQVQATPQAQPTDLPLPSSHLRDQLTPLREWARAPVTLYCNRSPHKALLECLIWLLINFYWLKRSKGLLPWVGNRGAATNEWLTLGFPNEDWLWVLHPSGVTAGKVVSVNLDWR